MRLGLTLTMLLTGCMGTLTDLNGGAGGTGGLGGGGLGGGGLGGAGGDSGAGGVAPMGLETAPIAVAAGTNTIPLGRVGLVGATITFKAEVQTLGLQMSDLLLTSGTEGAHVLHPLFIVQKTSGNVPDPTDALSALDVMVPAASTKPLSTGPIVIPGFAVGDGLLVRFQLAEGMPAGAGGTGGAAGRAGAGAGGRGGAGGAGGAGGTSAATPCTNVGAFTQYATPVLRANCTSCHGDPNNAAAQTALNLASVQVDTVTQQTAGCNLVKRKMSANAAASPLFAVCNPPQAAAAGHPFNFGGDVNAYNAFRGQVLLWYVAE